LGHSGILKGKEATTYHLGDGHRRKELAAFGANVLDRPLVSDANICTSSCPSTAVDVALWLLGQLTGEDNAADVRKLMGFDD
jgi:4-methyl-5(b-hydroxyethyl)-thiazole monophosphate biosynthesis